MKDKKKIYLGALLVGGILLYNNWDRIKQAIKTIKNNN